MVSYICKNIRLLLLFDEIFYISGIRKQDQTTLTQFTHSQIYGQHDAESSIFYHGWALFGLCCAKMTHLTATVKVATFRNLCFHCYLLITIVP